MRFILLLALVILVSGCLWFQSKSSTTTITEESVAKPTYVIASSTIDESSTTSSTTFATSTTLAVLTEVPAYAEGDFWNYSVVSSVAGHEFQDNSLEVKYVGKSDTGREIIERRLYSVKNDPGQSSATLTSSFRDHYLVNESSMILEDTVEYQKASTGAHKTYSYSPGIVYLVFPLEVGSTWNGSSDVTAKQINQLLYKSTIEYYSKVLSIKEISIKAGVFQCAEIENTEKEYFGKNLIQTKQRVLYYCPTIRYYGFWSLDLTLPSGRKTGEILLSQYRTTLDLEETHENNTLNSYEVF